MNNFNNGSIHLILGPMFSGKTSELLRLKKRTDIANKKSIIIRYCKHNYISRI